MKMPDPLHHPASYRDPSGFIFQVNGIYYRQVSPTYAEEYALLMESGLYRLLTEKKLLIAHKEVRDNPALSDNAFLTLCPEQLTTVSYPYEWSFDQLKDAALLTLSIMRIAIDHGMILKDAAAFNIQFREGMPLFIDTLSFERYDPSRPWVAYRQFCECFLFPLLLEHYANAGLQKILSVYPDGIPASVTARLLPLKSRFRLGVWLHVHLPNRVGNYKEKHNKGSDRALVFTRQKLLHLIQNLETTITGLKRQLPAPTVWSNYYTGSILSSNYLEEKEKIFRQLTEEIDFSSALDIGANDGYFSHILSGRKEAAILAIDADNECINNLYRSVKEKKTGNILPLCVDISRPSPAIGFRNKERASFNERVLVDLVVALALIHHLVFGNCIPLSDIAACFADLTREYLIIEFVPVTDPKTSELIKNKTGIHHPYDSFSFENTFGNYFTLVKQLKIPGTERVLYLMVKKNKQILC
ncbi:hypothetical protein ACX0G9_06595 [Flavitalea flava]